ncbi:hypothetical protein OS493_004998 [Desmophyllum pertusum]|uniref:G-protein coupled receptors family 1 profile domain-containing protein n=1 Tax=Desmophyllum pertusum TaxID=174260 RepID=A0A9W9Z3Y3_9CNID|nr:hypothetical protein OS493_004998 [Desmophyllum pertusum]
MMLKGKAWAIISSSLHLELALLNLVSMSVLMLDRFLAVYLDLKYFTWKTNQESSNSCVPCMRILLNLPPLQAEARLQMDIKATKTVSMAIATFYICYIPAIIVSIWYHDTGENTRSVWAAFMATICMFISSASNPVIYVLRNRRYRCAFWQLVKDPCGARAFQEKPVRARKPEEKQREKKPPIEGEPGYPKDLRARH